MYLNHATTRRGRPGSTSAPPGLAEELAVVTLTASDTDIRPTEDGRVDSWEAYEARRCGPAVPILLRCSCGSRHETTVPDSAARCPPLERWD